MKIYRNLIAIGEQDGVIIALDITPLILGAGITTGLGVGIITIRYLNRRMRRLVAEGKRPAPKSRLSSMSTTFGCRQRSNRVDDDEAFR